MKIFAIVFALIFTKSDQKFTKEHIVSFAEILFVFTCVPKVFTSFRFSFYDIRNFGTTVSFTLIIFFHDSSIFQKSNYFCPNNYTNYTYI